MSKVDDKEQLQNHIHDLEARFAQLSRLYDALVIEHKESKEDRNIANRIVPNRSAEIQHPAANENATVDLAATHPEAHYKDLFNLNPLPMWIYDSTTFFFLEVNEAAIRHYGYTRDEFLNMSVLDIRSPEEKERLEKHGSKIREESPIHHGYWKHLKKNGEIITVEITARLITYNAQKAILVLSNDITQKIRVESKLVKSNRRLEAAQQIARIGYWDINVATLELYWSDQAFVIFGVQKTDTPPRFKDSINLIHPDDRDLYLAKRKAAFKGKSLFTSEHRIVLQDGTIKTVFEKATLIYNEDDIPVMFEGIVQDITERKQAEKIIEENERRMKNAQYVGSVGDWEYDCIAKKMNWSDELFRLLAMNPADGVPALSDFVLLYAGEDASHFYNAIQLALEEGKNYELDLYLQLPYKPDAYHYSVGQVLKDDQGRIIKIYGIVQDITERKQAEIKLKEERNLLRTLIDNLPDSIYIKDVSGRKIITNAIDMQLMGVTREKEVIGKTDLEIFSNHLGSKGYKDDMEVIKTGVPILNREECFVGKDGLPLWLLTSKVAMYNEAGEINGLLGIGRIITERKLTEEALRTSNERYLYVTKATFDAIWDWDIVNDHLYWGEGYEIMFGYKISATADNHIHSFDNIHPEDRKAVFADIDKLLAGTELNWISEYRYLKADGSYAHVQDKGVVIRDANGKAVRMIGAMQDITERKMAIEAIKKTQEKFTSLVNTIDGIVWEADARTFQFTYVSKHAEKLLGYSTEQWVNEPNFWASHMHPDDRNWAVNYCVECTRQKKEHQFEYRMIAADGRIVWLADFVTVVVEMGKPIQLRGVMVDITDRKKTEEALVKERQLLRLLIDNLPDYIYVKDKEARLIITNKANLEDLGFESDEKILGKNIVEILGEQEGRVSLKDDRQVLMTGKAIMNREYILNKNGKPRWLLITKIPIRDADNKVIGVVGINRDITEQKLTQQTLAESESYLRTIIQTEPECLKLLDINGNLENMNPAGLAMIEADSLEMVKGRPIVSVINQSYREAFLNLNQNVFKGISGKLEFEITGLKGTKRWMETHVVPMRNAKGDIISSLGITRDISDRKKAQEALVNERKLLRLLIDNLPDYIYVKDESARHIINNKANFTLLGFEAEEGTIGKTIVELVGEKAGGKFIQDDKTVLQSGHAIIDREEPIYNREGDKRWLLTTKIPFKDENENVIGLVGISRDITERKQKDEELKEKNTQLKNLSKHLQSIREEERKSLAREVHDELGQLVSAVKMDIDWLNIRIPDLQEGPKKRLLHASATADLLINTIRKIASTLRPSMLDDFGLNTALAWQCKEFTEANGIPCEFEQLFDDSYLSIEMKTELFRICQESLTNVMRHAEPTCVKVSINLRDEGLYMCITDNGKGFDSKLPTETLGLIGMRERALSINGRLSINSVPGKGTTICAILPKSIIDI